MNITNSFKDTIKENQDNPNSNEDSHKNALRHTIWQALISRFFGEKTAIRIGNAHEEKTDNPFLQADTEADQKNNAIGRMIGQSVNTNSSIDIVLEVLNYYRDHGLWEITKQGDEWVIEQKRISQEQYSKAKDEIMKLNRYGKEN